jgi:hypothetical protein
MSLALHLPQETIPRGSYSIDQWCQRHHVSRSFFYKLRKLGLTPTIMNVNGLQRISVEADERWTREREETAA